MLEHELCLHSGQGPVGMPYIYIDIYIHVYIGTYGIHIYCLHSGQGPVGMPFMTAQVTWQLTASPYSTFFAPMMVHYGDVH